MSRIDLKVPNIGEFKDVEVIELLISEGQTIKKYNIDPEKPIPTKL